MSGIRMAYELAGGAQPARTNTVRLDLPRLIKLLDLLDEREKQSTKANRRFVRWPFRHVCVSLSVIHADKSRSALGVACRNISCGGLSVLHNAYIYPGNACEVTLPRLAGGSVIATGTIARCNHLSGVVHEVGIKFAKDVQISQFIDQGGQADALAVEKVDQSQLKGDIALCGLSDLDQQFFRHHLRETGLQISVASTAQEALALAAKPLVVVFVAAALDSATTPSLTDQLRSAGLSAPIVVLESEAGATAASTRMKADAVLTMPLSDRTLLQVIASLSCGTRNKGLYVTSLPPDHPSMCLVQSFVDEVKKQSAALEQAIRQREVDGCRAVCRQIAGIAPMVGFEAMASLAHRADSTLAATPKIEEAAGDLQQLLSACARARAA